MTLLLGTGCGSNDAPYQSDFRPRELRTLGPVQAAGSDWRSWYFNRFTLPSLITLANKEYTHSAVVTHFERIALDPARLKLEEGGRIRVYFVGEGSGYINALGINLEGVGINEGWPRLLFSNPSTNVQLDACAAMVEKHGRLNRKKLGERTKENSLLPGDFIDLGWIEAGTVLNFFLVANSGEQVYTALPDHNPDGMKHMVAIAVEDSPYLLLSFEDMYQTGDADYEDCVFAVELSAFNVQALVGKIDPWRRVKQFAALAAAITLVAGGPLFVLGWRRRARRKRIERDFQAAQDLIQRSRYDAALSMLRKTRGLVTNPRQREDWLRLETQACVQWQDLEGLREVFAADAAPFAENESAALLVARVEVEHVRGEEYAAVRGLWRERETRPDRWLGMDADWLRQQGHEHQAHLLLSEGAFEGTRDAGRLARLAYFRAQNNPQESLALLHQAISLQPNDPEVHLHAAMTLERLAKSEEALPEYKTALSCAPRDPLIRDAFAEALRRQGNPVDALRVWCEGLQPPSLGLIWSKTLFWSRVLHPVPVDWPALPVPEGPLQPLVNFLLHLDENRFWDAASFAPIVEHHRALATQQEVFWLQVLEAFRTGQEQEALQLLSLQGFGVRSWHPELEIALVQLVQYRLRGFIAAPAAVRKSTHPFFADLMRWAQEAGSTIPPDAHAFLISNEAFAAACFAAGWKEAGRKLQSGVRLPEGTPGWYKHASLEAGGYTPPENQVVS